MSRHISVLVAVAVVAGAVSATAAPGAPALKISAYVQARYTLDAATGAASTFEVRRARFTLDGTLTEQAAARLQIEGSPQPSLYDVYCDLQRKGQEVILRAGQFKVPMSYEVIESISEVHERELSEAWTRLAPGCRDIGVHVMVKGTNKAPSWDIAALNGNGRNRGDNNEHKDVMVRQLIPVEGGTVELGYYTGKFTDGAGVTTVRSRLVAGTELEVGRIGVRAEYIAGRDLGAEIAGGYLRLSGRVGQKKDLVFVKYDGYDENTDAPNTTFNRVTVGCTRFLDPNTRLTALYQFKDVDPGYSRYGANDGDLLLVECQMKFKN